MSGLDHVDEVNDDIENLNESINLNLFDVEKVKRLARGTENLKNFIELLGVNKDLVVDEE
jgi:hypothetical protein